MNMSAGEGEGLEREGKSSGGDWEAKDDSRDDREDEMEWRRTWRASKDMLEEKK